MSCLHEVQTISKSPHILPMPSLARLPMGGVLNPLKNTTNTSHNELLHQEPLQPPLEPSMARVKVVPHGCAVARRVAPVAHGLHAVIPESRCLHCRLLAKRGHKYRLSAVTVTHYHRVMGDTPFRDLAEQRAGPRPRDPATASDTNGGGNPLGFPPPVHRRARRVSWSSS